MKMKKKSLKKGDLVCNLNNDWQSWGQLEADLEVFTSLGPTCTAIVLDDFEDGKEGVVPAVGMLRLLMPSGQIALFQGCRGFKKL